MDLSWSSEHKADATTVLQNLQNEVKKNINDLSTNVHQLDSVTAALNEGKTTFEQILCDSCKTAIDSKYKELHSGQDESIKKKKYLKLPPERQRIVNEITKVFMQLERSQNASQADEEYCTPEEYQAQQKLELENTHKKALQEKQAEVLDLKKQIKKLTTEREENMKKIKSLSSKLSSAGKFESELRRYENETKRLRNDLESSERRNEQLRKDIDRHEDETRKQRQLLNEERSRRDTTDLTDGSIRRFHEDPYTASTEVHGSEIENDGNTRSRKQIQMTDQQTGQNKTGLIRRSSSDMVSSNPGLEKETDSGNMAGNPNSEETLERFKKIEKGATIVQKENDGYRRDIAQLHRERKSLQDKTDNLQRTNEEMASVMRDLQRDNEKLIREMGKIAGQDNYNSDLVKARKGERYDSDQNDGYEREIARLKRERRTLREEIDSLRRKHQDTSSAMRDLQRDHDGLTEEFGIKEQETHEMKKALEEGQNPERRSLVMRLRRGNRTGIDRTTGDMFLKDLTRNLKERLDSDNIDFSISNTPSSARNGPVFVLCLNTDVQVAQGGIKGNKDTYILALHHIDEENLSLLTPTGDNIPGNDIEKLGGILDMAFSCDNILYECDLNNSAAEKIITILKQY
ncbi:trichohyalin-like [Ylistrum balloti]|uniref:trichohyalin-like n=1 Tax=Ylistrum balloti TaxID=509963 RepID=UPI002905E363|nr:trichohyalin-like [Ylistrum balloti]